VPIGKPISNTRIYLLDPQYRPVPIGAVGELYIGGVGVARGYLNRPELTEERFLPDPFALAAGKPYPRMYRTGDLARYLPDGNIVFLGRNDHQVKIRGLRIELGEIEAQLAQHEAVREAVVVAREAADGETHLVAYIIASEQKAVAKNSLDENAVACEQEHLRQHEAMQRHALAHQLRAHLQAKLPDYMVPAAFVQLDALPVTANGKLDRKALPAPSDEAFARHDYEAPQGEIEQILAALWCELLNLDHIGRHDDFFELGGHSLLAVRLLSRLPAALAVEVPLSTLFAHPTLRAFAAAIGTARSGTHVRALPPITPTPRARTVPLSFAQQRLWFLAALEGESTTYHVPVILRLRGSLDAAAWRHAMDTVWRRHEALRTVFPVEQGQPTARLLPAENGVPWRQFDLSSSADALTELRRLCESEARALFDLATGPLIRASLMRIAEGEHVFMVVQHHIVSDGWSIRVLLSELLAHYQASINADIAPLPDLSIQYPDYVAWQRRWLNAERLADEARYWRQTLSGAPALLTLPTDRPRPPRQQFAAAHVPVTLDADLANALRRTCRQHGVTLFMLMVAAWAVVLARLSGQSEVVIGAPTANRPRAELEPLIGLFVNTLALRIDLAGQPDLAALLTRVRRTVLGAQEHQNLPFEQVVELAQPWRQLDHTPIFQVMIAWQEVDIRPLQSRTLRIEPIGGTFDQVKFDLELDLADDGRTINGALRYATALFDEPTARRHSGYLATMLRAIAEGAAPAPTQVALVGADEREILLGAFNRTDRRYQADCCVHEQIERQAQSAPDAIAIECDDQRITYAQLNARANRLAHHLITLGVRPDARVAVCASRSPDLVAGLLAVLKAGGAYVPVDPIAPGARIAQVLADAAPVAVLVDSSTRETLANRLPVHLPVLELDAPRAAWRNASDTNLRPHRLGLTPRHLAYVIYTSGSTGTPKGVMVEHRQLVNLIAWHINRFELRSGSRTTCTAGLAFDAAAWEIWPALASGATLLLPPSSVHNDTAALLHWWRAQRIDCAFLVTPLAMLAIEAGLPPGLRRLLIGGDRFSGLPAPLPASVQLFNNYGPTEATVVASSGLIDRDESTPTIGRPIDNARIYLLDENGEPAPLGAPGEIYIGGAGVARGYLNRAELDAQRFLPDPFARAAGDADARMYRTGDLARYLPDGRIVFLGRNDQQIKIRGYRIELGEIEAQLRTHAAVGDVAVIAQDDEQGAPRLIAYLVAQADAPERSALTTALRAHLQARLPDYMTPAAFIWLDALPLTSNGKLDRHALPAPGPAAFDRGAYEAPIGAVETMLAEVWERLLGADRIGRHDNFFMLGGHSLLAAQMISEVRATLGRDLSIRTLFEAPTIAQLSERIDRGASSDALSVLLPLREQGHGAPLFCVHPAGGFSWPYAGLLRYLPERPLFALQARSLRGERAAATIEAMASDYLAQIRTVQPEGPYHLLGWSLGCHIAHAIATQLQDSGEHVEQLIMLDGYPIASDAPFAPPSEQDIMQVLVGALSDAPLPPPDHALTLSTVKARLVESSNGVLSALGDGVVEAIFDEFKVAPRLAARFKPRTYRGDILFFRARHADTELSPRAWQPYVDGRIESHDIDCAHEAMMRPHALAQLGPRLAAALQRETAS
jgi:amino acid adenylation domain-containing protein